MIDYIERQADNIESGIGPFGQLKISFEMKQRHDGKKLHYDLWIEGGEKKSLEFINKWKPYHEKIAEYAEFTPHYVNYKCAT